MSDKEHIIGPFFDEEFFSYHDARHTVELDAVEMHHTNLGFIGIDDLQVIYDQGRKGTFDKVIFSGIATLKKTNSLCEGGLKKLLKEVQRRDPSVTAENLDKACRQGKVKVELQCQLALMPVCYMTRRPANSIVIYSKNYNNVKRQRRYVIKTFHISCFRRSELSLWRYALLKFTVDACFRYDVPREERDVHWLVEMYLKEYNHVFQNHQRPRLHRSEVYDHYATHAKWLGKILARKTLVDRSKWEEWIEEAKVYKSKAKKEKVQWGVLLKKSTLKHDYRPSPPPQPLWRDGDYITPQDNNMPDIFPDTDAEDTSSEPDESTESESSDDNVLYEHDPSLFSRTHQGLFKPMPVPTWYWACDIKEGCKFVIDIGNKRSVDASCMAPLSPKEKEYLTSSMWGLYDAKLAKIWKKMCQAHMDWHWREAGIVLDHRRKKIYGVEEEDDMSE